jgi:hypothetical protein
MASPTQGPISPRLFISYSHDSREHQDRVRALADRLRQDGIDAAIDQYNPAPVEGWPRWMDGEISKADFVALICTDTYLRRVEGRETPGKGLGVLWEATLIYNHLYVERPPVQRFIPILLPGATEACIPWPLRGMAHYATGSDDGYEDFYRHLTAQPRHQEPMLGKLRSLPIIAPQSYPASLAVRAELKARTSADQRNRVRMLLRVRQDWIEGVLKQSLYNVARIELGLQTRSDAVEQLLKAIVQTPDSPPATIPRNTPISQIFRGHGNALLILGAPGTGKTTLLLELAEQLLDLAEQDEHGEIPVVFNLSSWAVRRHPLERWLISELNERSGVPKTLARRWVESEQILPLLDGLDEVAQEHREACVAAINDFRRNHGLLPIAVCSRIADYEALGTKLRLRSAVVVQPLTRMEVLDYVERTGLALAALRDAFTEDPTLWDLLETPLMLWVAALASRHADANEFAIRDTLGTRRNRLFSTFVSAMLKRRSRASSYTPQETISWTAWLASAMRRNEQSVFYLEDLAPKWLRTRAQMWLLRLGVAVASGLSLGFILVIFSSLYDLPTYGVSKGLNFWLEDILPSLGFGFVIAFGVAVVGTLMGLRPVETMRISLVGLAPRLRTAARYSLGVGFSFGLTSGTLIALFLEGTPVEKLVSGILLGSILGLIVGLVVGLISLVSGEIEIRTRPNQGTYRSLRSALATGMLVGAVLGLVFMVVVSKVVGNDRSVGFLFGMALGVIFAFIAGGLFSLQHALIRLMLWMNGSAPFRYVRFLDYAVESLMLRKAGGGYIFLHRMLLEYFASLREGGLSE